MLIPFFWMGSIGGRDFCMNVSLPSLYVLMIYMISYVKDEIMDKRLSLKNFILLVCLVCAVTTPIFNWVYKTKTMISQKTFVVQDDSIYTLSDKSIEEGLYGNFLAPIGNDSLFDNYLAK
jgi:hypothetical protein